MDQGTIFASIIGLLTTVAGAVGTYMTMKHKHQMEMKELEHKHSKESRADDKANNATAIAQYIELAERLEKQNERWEADSQSKQKLIDDLVERDTLCQIRLHQQYGWMQQASTWMSTATGRIQWLTVLAREKGHEIMDMVAPPVIPNPPKEYDHGPEFHARSQAQNTETIRAASPVNSVLQKPNGGT